MKRLCSEPAGFPSFVDFTFIKILSITLIKLLESECYDRESLLYFVPNLQQYYRISEITLISTSTPRAHWPLTFPCNHLLRWSPEPRDWSKLESEVKFYSDRSQDQSFSFMTLSLSGKRNLNYANTHTRGLTHSHAHVHARPLRHSPACHKQVKPHSFYI